MQLSFTRQLDRHMGDLQRFALFLTHDASDADDLVQDTAERALTRRRAYQRGTNIRAWLMTVMKNLHIDNCRKRQRRGHPLPIEEHESDFAGDATQLNHIYCGEVADAISTMSHHDQDILLRAGVGGESYEQLSRHFNIAVGTVKSRLNRARTRLREATAY